MTSFLPQMLLQGAASVGGKILRVIDVDGGLSLELILFKTVKRQSLSGGTAVCHQLLWCSWIRCFTVNHSSSFSFCIQAHYV